MKAEIIYLYIKGCYYNNCLQVIFKTYIEYTTFDTLIPRCMIVCSFIATSMPYKYFSDDHDISIKR